MRFPLSGFVLAAALTLTLAAPAAQADITVVGRYTFVNGDTATRTLYYARKRVRLTAPDGSEFIFDSQGKNVTIINHQNRTYWKGSVQVADSLASLRIQQSNDAIRAKIEAHQDEFAAMMQNFNSSIASQMSTDSKPICGYPTDKWVLSAGEYLYNERWMARSLQVVNYNPDLEKVVMASVLDPMGRVMMRMLMDQRGQQDGIPLAGTTIFKTFTQSGTFTWEATQVLTGDIPSSAWDVPSGYTRIKK